MRIAEKELLVAKDGTAYLGDIMVKNYPEVDNFTKPENVNKVMIDVFNLNKKAEEHLYMIVTNKKQKPVAFFEISHGKADTTMMDIRGIMVKALLSNAINIFLVHNHPSSDSTPSFEDMQVTKKIKDACKLMEINLQDHILILPRLKHVGFLYNT